MIGINCLDLGLNIDFMCILFFLVLFKCWILVEDVDFFFNIFFWKVLFMDIFFLVILFFIILVFGLKIFDLIVEGRLTFFLVVGFIIELIFIENDWEIVFCLIEFVCLVVVDFTLIFLIMIKFLEIVFMMGIIFFVFWLM